MFGSFVGPGLYISYAALSAASGISDSTLRSWAGGTSMTLSSVLDLARHLPVAAINMMFEPAGKRLCDAEREDANWHAVAAESASFVSEICTALIDGRIDHVERHKLSQRAKAIAAQLVGAAGLGT